MNVELAEAALDAARRHRDRFDMDTWHAPTPTVDEYGDRLYFTVAETVIDDETRVPPCGTVGCYAGFVTFMTAPAGTIIRGGELFENEAALKRDHPFGGAEFYAAKQLGITLEQASVLFYLATLEEVEGAVAYLADNPNASERSLAKAAGSTEFDFDGEA